jgi:hypothetical protein
MGPVYDEIDRFSYNWEEHPQWRTRYPPWVFGRDQWMEYAERLNGPPDNILLDKLPDLSARTLFDIRGRCPRVFISHRQKDAAEALRVAQLVQQCGYDYWLDILNPELLNIPAMALPEQAEAVAMASVIEMGLLNCSHVIALITPNTKGTLWIPYEYGRVKEPAPVALQAACWVHRDYTDPLPEYLRLGPVHYTEDSIQAWLTIPPSATWAKPPCAATSWAGPATKPLPCHSAF